MPRIRFTIRDLLWAMVVLGLSLALWNARKERSPLVTMTSGWRHLYEVGWMAKDPISVQVEFRDGSSGGFGVCH